jgi:hypothetical protein
MCKDAFGFFGFTIYSVFYTFEQNKFAHIWTKKKKIVYFHCECNCCFNRQLSPHHAFASALSKCTYPPST